MNEEQKNYCKGRGLNCNQWHYEKCIDSRGKEECKYCNPQKVDEYGTGTGKYIPGIRKDNNSDGMWFYIINDNWLLRSHGYDICNQIKPNYCPMCGRKLNDK